MQPLKNYFKHIELPAYSIVLVLSVLYSIFCFARSCMKYFENFQDDYGDFTEGYLYLSTKRDKTDIEWEGILYLLINYFPYTVLYLILIEVVRYKTLHKEVHQLCPLIFMMTYFQIHGNINYFLILFLQPLFFYFVAFFQQTFLFIWLSSGISLIFITIFKSYILSSEYEPSDEYQVHFFTVSMYWINLKCTGFYLENSKQDFLSLISYCFYPPTFFTGPFICYEDYKQVYVVRKKNHSKVMKLIKNLIWCMFWYAFGNFCLHFLYVNATSLQPQFVESLDYVSLCGYGYTMGQFFHIKYLIQYGLSTTLASYENVNVPTLPRCIGRVHLYSDMWRYFDPGLYTFLKRYIYLPMQKILHYKLLASFLCFCFVCVWHGLEDYIVTWAVLNYIGITIEYFSSMLYQRKSTYISKVFGPTAINVITNLMVAPLLGFSAISNFYFFGGKDIGDIFLRKLFGNPFDGSRLLLVLYCCCQVSTSLRNVQARKM